MIEGWPLRSPSPSHPPVPPSLSLPLSPQCNQQVDLILHADFEILVSFQLMQASPQSHPPPPHLDLLDGPDAVRVVFEVNFVHFASSSFPFHFNLYSPSEARIKQSTLLSFLYNFEFTDMYPCDAESPMRGRDALKAPWGLLESSSAGDAKAKFALRDLMGHQSSYLLRLRATRCKGSENHILAVLVVLARVAMSRHARLRLSREVCAAL
eukprot:746230-Hanusia_phi.AAC.6